MVGFNRVGEIVVANLTDGKKGSHDIVEEFESWCLHGRYKSVEEAKGNTKQADADCKREQKGGRIVES